MKTLITNCPLFGGQVTAQRIYQDLVLEQGFTGSYEVVKRYVRRLRVVHPGRVYRVEYLPGEEAQVDFCEGAPIQNSETRKKRRPPCLRVTLSFSRKGYSEAIPRQTTEGFIRCLENALQVKKRFEEHARVALKPLPLAIFPCFEEGQRTVHRDSYVEVGRAYYEVPKEYIGALQF